MASVAFNPCQNHVFSIIFFRDTLSLTPTIHSSSHIFCPFVYHRVSIEVRQVRKRTHATPAEVESRDHSTCQAVDSGVSREPGTGFCLSSSVDESVGRKPKKNEGTTLNAIDSARCGKTGVGFSSLRSADGSLKRKLKKSDGNVVCAVDSGMHREMGAGISSLRSRREGEERKPKKVEDDRRNPMTSRSNREIASKYSSLMSREGGFDRKSKRNESSCFADEKVEMKYKRHRLLQKAVDSRSETSDGFSLLRSIDERVDGQINGPTVDAKMERGFIKQKQTTRCSTESRSYGETGAGYSLMRSKDRSVDTKLENNNAGPVVVEKLDKKKANKSKADIAGVQLRIGLDMCSKRGDVMGAISLYDTASRKGMEFGQYHYNVLLYLCSSAAVGVVQQAKSGSGGVSGRIFDKVSLTSELPNNNSVDSSENGDSNDETTDTVKPESLSIGSGGNFGGSCNNMESELRFSSRSSLDLSENGTSGRKHSEKMVSISSGFQVDSAKHNGKVSLNEVKQNPQFSSSTQYGIVNGLNYNKVESGSEILDGFTAVMEYDSENSKDVWNCKVENAARVSDDIKKYALERGFEIYKRMCLEKVPLNEAALTSVARMAMAIGNGDMAFEMVKQMKALGINPRLRSYGPALFTFCNKGDIEKAFEVEKHMLECGVYPEEPELEALLRLSVEAGRGEKVYYLLHKLRTSRRQVSPSTADLIEKWFKSTAASRVGKRKLDGRLVSQAVEHGGGGWHGLGWLGRGKWTVRRATVGVDGICMGCREKLATIDIDPIETENFAESVAAIARKREQNSSFQIFQKWLDYYGPFEAVVDAANVGLFSQRRFSLSRVNAVVNGIRQKLPSKKLPLIVVHNKRISGRKMTDSPNRQLIDKWKTADALYATPTGSNDDWYWLYAAIKFKCLTVTNDEMRDHIFQLLGNDFFPKWKERHQVHFSFCEGSPEFHMPPPCSVVIQESEKGHWHIPIVAEQEPTRERMWLCVMRATSPLQIHELCGKPTLHDKECASADGQTGNQTKLLPSDVGVGENIHLSTQHPDKIYASSQKAVLSEFLAHHTVISKIVSAEMIGGCVIDFQI